MNDRSSPSLTEFLVSAERIVVFTGAGISTAAGIPDYRGPAGVWKTRPEISLSDYLEDAGQRSRYWAFKAEDWRFLQDARPTPAHEALVRLQELGKLSALITQNIDGLHARSGILPEILVELHGRIDRVACLGCGFSAAADPWYAGFLSTDRVPDCPRCGHVLKPGVIQFGEPLREEDLRRAQEALFEVDLVMAIGSTLAVQPAATFPLMAARMGVPYIILNRGETAHDGLPHVSLRLEGDIQELLPPAVADAAAMFG